MAGLSSGSWLTYQRSYSLRKLVLPLPSLIANSATDRGGTSWWPPPTPCCDSVWFELLQIVWPLWSHRCNCLDVSTKHCFLAVIHRLWLLHAAPFSIILSFKKRECDIDVYFSSEHSTFSYSLHLDQMSYNSRKERREEICIVHSVRAIASYPPHSTMQICCRLNWKCLPWAPMFEHMLCSWWYCLRWWQNF